MLELLQKVSISNTMLRFSGRFILAISLFTLVLSLPACFILEDIEPRFSTANTGPYQLSVNYMETVRNGIESGQYPLQEQALAALLKRADERWLPQEPYSVVHSAPYKKDLLTSGDIHDYLSLYTFAWSDSSSITGYTTRPEQPSPDLDKFDRVPLAEMSKAVEDLSLAWYFTNDSRYAEKAAQFIRTWFLDKATRMNPNLNHTQMVPGVGRGGQGIVETRDFIPVIEAASLIYESEHWSPEEHKELKRWFYRYLQWIYNVYPNADDLGGNIGTWFDSQKYIFTLFTEQERLLNSRSYILPLSERMASQIEADGYQTSEMSRHNAQHYTYFNLKGYIVQAELQSRPSADREERWTASTSYSASLRSALDWLTPYAMGEASFIRDFDFYECRYIELYRPAALAMNMPEYEAVVESVIERHRPGRCVDILTLLTHPPLQ
ncbi:MAG: alginate lyase family protein [Balneolaceae bacterium]